MQLSLTGEGVIMYPLSNKKGGEGMERRFPVRQLCVCGLMAAVICVLGPLAVPIGPVPVAFANLAIYLTLYLLDWRWATASCLVYLLLGLAGLPVFSGFVGGAGKLLGPTGGYLVGYLPMAALGGWVVCHTGRRWLQLLGMIAGTALCYLLGTAWFCWQGGYTVGKAIGLCVTPFIPFDLLKMLAALAVGPIVRKRLTQAQGTKK